MKNFTSILLLIAAVFFMAPSPVQAQKKKKENREHKVNQADIDLILEAVFEGERQELLDNPEEAAKSYRRCIELDGQNDVCYFKLASVYYKLNRYSAAVNLLEKAVELNPENKWYLILQAQCYMMLGNIAKASKTVSHVIELDPYNPEYQLQLADLYVMQEKYKEAIELLDEFEKNHGVTPEISMHKQSLYIQNNQIKKAIEECKKLIGNFPDEPNYYGMLGELYLQDNNEKKALETFQQLLEMDPENGLAHFTLSNYYRNNGDSKRADEEMLMAFESKDLEFDTKLNVLLQYSQIIELNNSYWPFVKKLMDALEKANPDDAKTFAIISSLYYQQKDIIKARDYAYKAIAVQKDMFQVWNQLVIMDSELQDWDAMIKDAGAALELFPSNPAFYYYLGIAHMQKKNYEDAIEILETGKLMIFSSEGGVTDFQTLLGDAYQAIGDYHNSEINYEDVLKKQPDNVYVLNNYSYYLALRKKKLDKAREMARKAVELSPGEYNYEDTYGWVLFQSGDYEEALEWLEKAVNHGGLNNGEVLEHYGDALFMTGQKEKALDVWKKAKLSGDASELIDEKIREQKIPGK